MTDLISIFETRFSNLDERTRFFITGLSDDGLFCRPENEKTFLSHGELILRSAGRVEQAFGGITARLWDDPFEWSLPEELSTAEKILDYLDEVSAVRARGFSCFISDEDLKKTLPAPVEMKTVFEVLLETLVEAEHYLRVAIRTEAGETI